VTERITPLSQYLEDRNILAISWGLHQVAVRCFHAMPGVLGEVIECVSRIRPSHTHTHTHRTTRTTHNAHGAGAPLQKAIGFLVDSQMTHNNICLSSIVVDTTGEWKLGGLELLRRSTDDPNDVIKMPTPVKYQPPEKKGAVKKGHPWSDDMWGFGCLIWEVFNGELPRPERLTDVDYIPKKLLAPFVKLIGANPKSRPSPQNFIAEARNNGRYLDNDYVNATFFLEEINLKSPEEVGVAVGV
jgi:hypothetical protein